CRLGITKPTINFTPILGMNMTQNVAYIYTHGCTHTHTQPHTHTHTHTQTLLPGDLPGLRLVCKALGETTEQGVCCSGQTVMKLAEPYQPPAETKTDYAGTFRGNSAGTSCNKREVSWG